MSAITAVQKGMSAVQAARKFGVPSRTLYDKVKKLGIQTSRPPKRTTNGANIWSCRYGVAGNANGGIYSNAQPKVENENDNVAENMVNTNVATAASSEAAVAYSNAVAIDVLQDHDSMSDTTRSAQSPVISRCVQSKQQEQQNMDDEVEDLSVSRKSDIPMAQALTVADAIKGERGDSEQDNDHYI